MPRRGENIFKRKDGRWEARFIHHYENGKAKYRYIYGRSYTEVKQKRLSEQQNNDQHTVSQRQKDLFDFESFAALWLSNVKVRVKESTYTRYERIVYKYLKPAFSKICPRGNTSDWLTQLPEYLLQNGGIAGGTLSPKTVSDILCVLKSILKFGQQNNYQCPAGEGIKYPQRTQKKIQIMDEESRKRLERIILSSDSVECLGILLALFTGIRIGELCGLKWGDFNFINQTICISRTVERIADLDPKTDRKTKVVITPPKTNSAERVIPMPEFLWKRLIKFTKSETVYLLTGNIRPMEPHRFYLCYRRFLKQNGFPEMSFHTLRHTFATRCVELGFDTKALSEILGHSSITTTLAIYVHPTLQQKRKQMERLVPDLYL